jgi:hypothetical protein
MSTQLVADLAERNRAKRYARYPWLEKLLKLMAEIEQVQEQVSSNVFSLVPSVEAAEELSHRIGLESVRPNSSLRAAADTPRFTPGITQPVPAT